MRALCPASPFRSTPLVQARFPLLAPRRVGLPVTGLDAAIGQHLVDDLRQAEMLDLAAHRGRILVGARQLRNIRHAREEAGSMSLGSCAKYRRRCAPPACARAWCAKNCARRHAARSQARSRHSCSARSAPWQAEGWRLRHLASLGHLFVKLNGLNRSPVCLGKERGRAHCKSDNRYDIFLY